jgi:hypothetical protein
MPNKSPPMYSERPARARGIFAVPAAPFFAAVTASVTPWRKACSAGTSASSSVRSPSRAPPLCETRSCPSISASTSGKSAVQRLGTCSEEDRAQHADRAARLRATTSRQSTRACSPCRRAPALAARPMWRGNQTQWRCPCRRRRTDGRARSVALRQAINRSHTPE